MTVFASKCEGRRHGLDNLLYPLHKSCEAANRRPSRLAGVRRKTLQTRLVRKLRRTEKDRMILNWTVTLALLATVLPGASAANAQQ
jgi:hypothetical protein